MTQPQALPQPSGYCPPSDRRAAMPPRRLARELSARLQAILGPAYLVRREITGGGMSRLFLADGPDGRVVVKVLDVGIAAELTPDRRRRFDQEIAITAALRHPHVIPMLGAGAGDDLAYYVMPWADGGSLRDHLRRHGPLAPHVAVRLLGEVAAALAHAHRHGVMHGDLKPENILLSRGAVLLADFGGARRCTPRPEHADAWPATGTAAAGLDTSGTVGTPLYMSPEQAAGDAAADPRADLYSLAVVGYELLTGRVPFSGSTADAVLRAHLSASVPPLARHRPDVPPALAAVLERALAKRPEQRPASAERFAAALQAALGSTRRARGSATCAAVGARITAALAPARERTFARRVGERFGAIAAAVMATVITAGLLAAAAVATTGGARPMRLARAAAPPPVETTTLVPVSGAVVQPTGCRAGRDAV